LGEVTGMIVTIDGPAGAGKSTVARDLAKRIGFAFLDTGAMYRTITLAALRANVDWSDSNQLKEVATAAKISIDNETVLLNGEDVAGEIRTVEITRHIRHVADHPDIREILVAQQRRITENGNYVSEGRDQGTVAFPNAECKIFLTASPEERAKRRARELQSRGEEIEVADLLAQQNARDEEDANRKVGALRMADDAIEFSTDTMTLQEVVDALERIVLRQLRK